MWGNFLEKEETVHNPFTYFGQTYDETTGLYYLRARYYDTQTGRFTQQDTAEDGYNWYVYGNNNPVLYVDETGEDGVAVTMLWDAFFGGGAYKDYSGSQEIVRIFSSSPNLNKIVSSNLSSFKNSEASSKTYSGTVSFYGNDKNLNDLDLHLAVGLANYSMTFTKETVSKRFLWKTWEETIYSVKITISDNYNFDNYREGEQFSDFLNNWGYNRQQKGTITPYYWSITFSKRGI